jgi:hypothetical protein
LTLFKVITCCSSDNFFLLKIVADEKEEILTTKDPTNSNPGNAVDRATDSSCLNLVFDSSKLDRSSTCKTHIRVFTGTTVFN